MSKVKIVGHRGARNEAPENTVEGFQHAVTNGCKHFELDIQLSSDKELIVYHDKSLKRTSGLAKKLSLLPYSALSRIDSRENTPGWPSPCYICNLGTVFDAVTEVESWQFEVKTDRRDSLRIIMDKLITFIAKHDLYAKCHVTSSNKWFLQEVKRKNCNIKIGYVCEYLYQRPVQSCINMGADLLVLNEKLATRNIVNNAAKAGIHISCWTVNELSRVDQLLALGVNNIITDIPSKLIEHYSE